MIELIQKLKIKYPNVVPVNTDETIYESVEMFNDTPIKINYFDFSQQIPESIEDMQRYHNDYILPSYYKESGSIQWNYYIYFIYDDAEKTIPNDALTLIEKNKDYARKIIFNKQEFQTFLDDDISSFYEQPESIGSDLIGIWRNQLDDSDLSMVYSENIPKSRIVEEFLADKKQQLKRNVKQKSNAELDLKFPITDNTFIDAIYLNRYRKYPKRRNFNCGTVNLIYGVNGAGKTSLLEGIEIVTCGKTFRSGGDNEPQINNLELEFSGVKYNIQANTNTTYQERDKKWYGSTNARGNKLYENFNKFNFYHTDAAYSISRGLDINDIIKNLVLGKEITFYEKRISESLERFEAEHRRLDRESKELKPRISKAEQEIEELNKSTLGTDELRDKLVVSLRFLDWQKDLLNKNEELDLDNTFLEIAQLKECVLSIKKLSESTGLYNLLNIEKAYEALEKDSLNLSNSIERIKKTREEKKIFLKKAEGISHKITNLQKLSEWLNVDNIYLLSGLEERLNKLKAKHIRLENFMYDMPPSEEMQSYSNTEDDLLSYLTKLTSNKDSLVKKKNESLKELKSLEDNVGKLNTYKSNLQDYALKVLSLSNIKTQCPVCRSNFSESKMKELVDEITSRVDRIEAIQKLKKEIEALNIQIYSNEKNSNTIDIFLKAGKKLFPEIDLGITAGKIIVRKILESQGVLEKLKHDIDYLENQKKRFLSMGITEIEYSKFISNYDERYSNEFGDLSQESLERIKKGYILELLSQEDTLKSFDKKIDTEEKTIKKLEFDYKVDFEKHQGLLEYLSNKKNKLVDMEKQIIIMRQYMRPQEMEVEYIVRNVSELSVIAKRFSDILIQNQKSSIAVKSLKNKIDTDKKRDTIVDTNLGKLEEAIGVLNELEPVRQRLSTFFEKNTQGILDVFMNIHAPKEFDGLSFSDGVIRLKRIGSEGYDPISKISTGQKSALALSIFLTMNKNAQNAPKYILFDDPVSDIDDINILAFFDFLREISISGERQIFFATASSKIANLFKKKFDFLGDNFEYYHLER